MPLHAPTSRLRVVGQPDIHGPTRTVAPTSLHLLGPRPDLRGSEMDDPCDIDDRYWIEADVITVMGLDDMWR